MAALQPRSAPRKTPVGDQRARRAQPLRLEVARRIEHFLHPRPALRSFVADHDDVTRLDLPGQYAGDRRVLAFVNLCRTREFQHAFVHPRGLHDAAIEGRSEEHTSELQSLMRLSYAVFCSKKKTTIQYIKYSNTINNTPNSHR